MMAHSWARLPGLTSQAHLYCLSENGVMALVEANPDSYVEKGRFILKTFDKFKVGGLGEEDEKPTWTYRDDLAERLRPHLKTLLGRLEQLALDGDLS